ncbi:transposon-related protein [Staphylococcus aureus]|nr:hypothetical protein M6K109_0344 [Staphylococcus aureus]SGV65677.1 transposon-related protein [Staphylococcus aureus]
MTEFTPFFDGSNQLNYLKFVILRFHGVSKRKICKMYHISIEDLEFFEVMNR